MKTLLDIETYGVRLYENEGTFVFNYDDSYAPIDHDVTYSTLEEALGDIVTYLLNPDEIYAMDEQDEHFQRAYALAGVQLGTNPIHPEITDAVATILYYVLDGIVRGNMRKEN